MHGEGDPWDAQPLPPETALWLGRNQRRAPFEFDAARVWESGRLMSELGRCAFCDAPFVQRRSDHRFCRPAHRKLGERTPGDGPRADPEDIRRLFDESRDPAEPVRPDDWHPGGPEWNVLDATDSLETRRRWFLELRDRGQA